VVQGAFKLILQAVVPRGSIAQNKYEIGGSFRGLGRLSRSSEANSDTAKKFVPGK